jgi:hypothetical protein
MFQAQKNDWRLALCMAIVITGFGVYTSRIDILFYAIAASCIGVGLCILFEVPKPHQPSAAVSPATVWYKQEKFRSLSFSLFVSLLFFYLGFLDRGPMPTLYHVALPVIIIVAPFFLFGAFLFAIVYIHSSYLDRKSQSERGSEIRDVSREQNKRKETTK